MKSISLVIDKHPQQTQQNQILAQFNEYKRKSIQQKQQLRRQFEKQRHQMNTYLQKLEKKYSAKLSQQRLTHQKKLQKMQASHQKSVQQFQAHVNTKNNLLSQLSEMIQGLQIQKKSIIQNNTKMLKQIAKDYQQIMDTNSRNTQSPEYRELFKMYQYLIQQNNELKKQLFLRNHQMKNIQDTKFVFGNEKIVSVQKVNQQSKNYISYDSRNSAKGTKRSGTGYAGNKQRTIEPDKRSKIQDSKKKAIK